ncbi:DUF933 domain-containing protein [bacterium]|nr:DUF933 domain-containing protein [bacterium]
MDTTIIGLAGTGKTTLLSALAGVADPASGVATVRVVDERVDALAKIFNPKKTTYAEMRVREAAWPGAGESARKSDVDRYLQAIRGSRLFLHVLAAAQTPMLADPPNPARDLAKLDGEMIIADLIAIERLLDRAKKAPLEANVKALLERLKGELENERPIFSLGLADAEHAMLSGYGFITETPQLVVVNTAEDAGEAFDAAPLSALLHGRHVMAMPFPVAREVSLLPAAEQDDFAKEMGLSGPAARRVVREAFRQLDLISFLTSGEDECRAWPIERGTHARAAAGTIHSDIERGFIRAEVVAFDEFIKRGSMKACREDGILRLEGKDYVVADGDIVHFRFNV